LVRAGSNTARRAESISSWYADFIARFALSDTRESRKARGQSSPAAGYFANAV
jgi:hypothetical protein